MKWLNVAPNAENERVFMWGVLNVIDYITGFEYI